MSVPEYTIAVGIGAAGTVVCDLWVMRTRVLADRRMWIVGTIVLFFMALMNGWLTSRPIVIYDDAYRALPRLGTIPLEDFLYGLVLVVQTLIWWERTKSRRIAGVF